MNRHAIALTTLLIASAALCSASHAADNAVAPRPLKVLVISMFGPEAEPWIKPLNLAEEVAVPGLSEDYPALRCNTSDTCLLTTGMGHANAAASTMAVAFDPRFDLSKTYFLIAGVAGIDPAHGTLGTAAWARYLVDYGIAHEIDAREMPKKWATGYFGIMTKGPGEKPKFDYRTEAFQLDEALLQKALSLTRHAELEDSGKARAYRKHYPQAAARRAPAVTQCDTLSGDTWWHGRRLGAHAASWARTLTNGKAVYCTTQQEDNATYVALARAAAAGKLDLKRLAVLRTGANFDRPYPGQSAHASLAADSGGFVPATQNLYRAGGILVHDIVNRWDQWKTGVPKD